MTRSLAPRPRVTPVRRPVPPDPSAVFHFACDRCSRPIWSHAVVSECWNCIDQAVKAFELGPLQGGVSGS